MTQSRSARSGSPSPRVGLPDLAWLVHEQDNELLRYSMRSVATHAAGMYRRVWIVGVLPEWVTGVGHIPAAYAGEKFRDIRAKVTALTTHPGIARTVVILNDDYVATRPVESWEPTHMGPTAAFLAAEAARGRTSRRNTWIRAVENTAAWMADQGHGDILCYEGHVPLAFDRARLAEALGAYPGDRSCDYPGFYPVAGAAGPGARALNAKIGPTAAEFLDKYTHPGMPGWVSTNDAGFREGMVGGFIRGLHPQPCAYEKGEGVRS